MTSHPSVLRRTIQFLKAVSSRFFLATQAIFFIVLSAISQPAHVCVTATEGVLGPTCYNTLKDAFNTINLGTHRGIVEIKLTGDITETASAFLNPSGSGGASYSSILIEPDQGVPVTVEGAFSDFLIRLNGADNIIINGSVFGSSLSFINSEFAVIILQSNASNNLIKGCTLKGSGSYVVGFGTGSPGNDENEIRNCNITSANDANVQYGIYSSNFSNGGNTIKGNDIYDYYHSTSSSAGMFLSGTQWSIENNRLFQSDARTYTTGAQHYGIVVNGGEGHNISGNKVGFGNTQGTGTTNMIGITSGSLDGEFPNGYALGSAQLNALRYVGIHCSFAIGGGISEIQNNTIGGFAMLTSSNTSDVYGIWCGIYVGLGNANIGTSSGNKIGAASGNGSVYVATSQSGGTVKGISVASTNTMEVRNNTIGAIDAIGTASTISGSFTGIDIYNLGVYTVSNNKIGNSTANNIRTGNLMIGGNLSNVGTLESTTGSISPMIGIRSTATGNALTITGNTIQGWASSCTAGTGRAGIMTSGTMTGSSPSVIVDGNYLGTSSTDWITYTVANSGTLSGISVTNTIATTHSIQNNDITGITYEETHTGGQSYIILAGATAANNVATVANNTFTSLSVNTTGAVSFIVLNYIVAVTGTQIVHNNAIVSSFSKTAVGGTINLAANSVGSSPAGATIIHSDNDFSNITVLGSTTISGWYMSAGGNANRTFSGNTFRNWTGGSGMIAALNIKSGGFAGGDGNLIFGNEVSNISSSGSIRGIEVDEIGSTATLHSNVVRDLSSYSILGISAAFIKKANIGYNIVNTLAADNFVTGINIAVDSVGEVHHNVVYDLSADDEEALVYGLSMGYGTIDVSNNIIGDLRAVSATDPNAIMGIYFYSPSTCNLYYNTIYLNASSSSSTTFGNSCMYFESSAILLNSRNNILVNLSTPAQNGANNAANGVVTCLRRSDGANGIVPANYATTSNNNFYWVNPSAGTNNHLTYGEGTTSITNSFNTLAAFQAFLVNRDQASVSEGVSSEPGVFFQSLTGSDACFLHIVEGLMTQVESGAVNIVGHTDDLDSDIRQGNAGYTGTGTAPDIGADEFGVTTCSNIVTSRNDCSGGSLRNVIACASPGSTITFDPELLDQTITLTSGEIVLDKDLIISGLGMMELTISGNDASRIFHLRPGNTVEIEGLALENGYWVTNGGAMLVEGNLILENVLFDNNYEDLTPKSMTVTSSATVEIIGNVDLKN